MENLVYHYTCLDALRGILRDRLFFWATRYDHLNDPSEQIWAESFVIDEVKNRMGYHEFSATDIQAWLSKDSYIISLSRKRDSRNMWRLYCNDGHGVCLILDRNELMQSALKKMNNNFKDYYCIIEDVNYCSEDRVRNAIDKCLNKKVFNIVEEEEASQWMRIVPFIKNKDFDVEHETRFAILRDFEHISIDRDPTSEVITTEIFTNNQDVKYRMRGNELIPFIEVDFPISSLKGIILGYEVDEKSANEYITSLVKPYRDLYQIKIIPSELFSTKRKNIYYNKEIARQSGTL